MADDIKATEENLISAMDRMQKQFEAVSTGMAGMALGMSKHAKALGLDEDQLKKLAEATGKARVATEAETEAEKALAESLRIAKERQDAYNDSLKKGVSALGSFGSALLENNVKLSNYGDAISKAGDAAFEFGKSIGPLGAVIGAVVKGATILAEAQLKQADALLGAKDELTKIGGAGAHTTESIRKMAREADLNSETLGRMVKPMKDMGSSIMILGNNAGAAQKEMAGLMKATAEERAMFSRLGMSQEEMMKGTADYIALQGMSGRMTKSELQDKEKLRKASQDYQMNLLDLAALSGKDVAELKEKQKAMALDNQIMVDEIQKRNKAAKLRDEATAAEQAGDKERAKALRASAQQLDDERANRSKVLNSLADAPEALQKGVKEILTTGSLSGENARVLAKMGMTGEVERLAKAIKSGAMTADQAAVEAAKAKDKYNKSSNDMIDSMGDSLKHSEDLRKSMGVNTESLSYNIQNAGKNIEKETKDQQARREAAGKPGQDTAGDARAAAQEATIQATGKMDDLVAATNPLIGEFNLLKGASVALTAAAGAAAIALGVLAAKKGIGTLAGAVGQAGGASGAVSGAAQTAATGASKLGSALKTGGKLLGKAATPLAVGMAAYEGYSDYKAADEKLKKGEITEAEAKKEKGKAVGSATGSAAGGVAGAVIGQMLIPIPGVGAAIGGLAGSWLGGKMGSWAGGKVGGASGATPAAAPGAPAAAAIPGATQTSGKPGEQRPEDKVREQEQKSSAEAISLGLDQVAKQIGLLNSELKQNTKQLKELNEQFKKYNDQVTAQAEALDPEKMADQLQTAVGGIGSTIKTAMTAAMGGQGGGAGGAPFTVSRMSMSRTGAPGSAGGGGGGGAGGSMPSIGNIPGIPERRLGPIIPGGMNYAGGGGGGTMPTIDAGTGPAVRGSPRGAGGDPAAAIASSLPSGQGGSLGSKQPAGPLPSAGAGGDSGGQEADKKGPPGGKFKDKEEFVKVMMPWAEYAAKQLGAPALGILGQWAGESGVGKNLPADYNYAGIKAGSKFAKGDYVLTEERYNQKQLDRAMKSGESLAGVIDSPGDTIRKKGRDVTIDQWYGAGAYNKAVNEGLNWVQVKSYFAKFNDLKDFADSYVGFLKNPRYADALKAGSAEDFGYAVAKAGYATASADKYANKVGSFAKSLSAREGGLAMGPSKGYAATLHGNEIIIPLDPNSILADLGKKSKAEAQAEMKKMAEAPKGGALDSSKELVAVNTQMMEMLSTKLDSMISKLETSNNTQSKLLKYSQA